MCQLIAPLDPPVAAPNAVRVTMINFEQRHLQSAESQFFVTRVESTLN